MNKDIVFLDGSDNCHSSITTYEGTVITEKGLIFLHLNVYLIRKIKCYFLQWLLVL